MVAYIIAVVLLAFAVLVVLVGKAFFYVPYKELKRRAARGDRVARTLYQAAAYDGDLKVLTWALVALSSAAGVVLFSRIAPPLIGFTVILLVLALAYIWLPRRRPARFSIALARGITPMVVRILRLLHPLLRRSFRMVERLASRVHTGLYEREDVNELIEQQRRQTDSRLSEKDLHLMQRALHLGEHKVRDVLVPRKAVKTVDINEALSPVLADELYASGHAFFPVYEDKTTDIVGLLALDSIADIKRHGTVRDYYSLHLAFVHEEDTLEQALRTLAESRQHVLIVVNSLNEYIGIVALSDITRWLLSATERLAGSHEDRDAVASRHGRGRISTEDAAENHTSVVQ